MKRRDFLKFIGFSTATLAISGFQRSSGKKPKDKPNIILIYTDDQGMLDANCYGTKYLHTPNIDSLAKRGIRFTHGYAHTVCCLSRAGLLTGRYPQRAGVGDWCMNFPNDTNPGHPIEGMPKEEVTLAEVFKKAGYRTALFGKWHLGGKEGHWPNDQGFDEFFGHLSGGIDAYTHKYIKGKNPPHDLYRNGKEVFEVCLISMLVFSEIQPIQAKLKEKKMNRQKIDVVFRKRPTQRSYRKYSITIPAVDSISLDGKLDEKQWQKALFIDNFIKHQQTAEEETEEILQSGKKWRKASYGTCSLLLHNEDYLYIGVEAEIKEGKLKDLNGKRRQISFPLPDKSNSLCR